MSNEENPVEPNREGPHAPEAWRQLTEEAEQWPEDHEVLQRLRDAHVEPLLAERGIGQSAASKEDKAGARLVHKHGGSADKAEVDSTVSYLRKNAIIELALIGTRTEAKKFVERIKLSAQITLDNESAAQHNITVMFDLVFGLRRDLLWHQAFRDMLIKINIQQRCL